MSTEGRRGASVRACVAGLGLLLTLGACGEDQPQETVDLPGASESASATPEEPTDDASPEESAPVGVPEPSPPPQQGDRVRGKDTAVHALQLPSDTPADAVGQALVDYMTVRVESYNRGSVDLARLSSVAMGPPMSSVQARVVELQQEGLRTVGDIWVDMTDDDVSVKGRTVRLSDVCMLNASVDVDDRGVAVESPPGAYLASGSARRLAADLWVIDTLDFESTRDC